MALFVFGEVMSAHAVERSSGFAVTNNYEHDADAIIIGTGDGNDPLPFEVKIASNAANLDHDRDKVCFYEHRDFRGRRLCAGPGEKSRFLSGFNDAISSIKVHGKIDVRVCQHAGYSGQCMTVGQDEAYVGDQWNDLISSFEVSNQLPGARDKVCFYEHTDFLGRELCVNPGERSDFLSGFNDAISSIRVWGKIDVRVCEHAGYGGRCMTVAQDETYVGDQWDDRISSYQVGNEGSDDLRQADARARAEKRQRDRRARRKIVERMARTDPNKICFYEDAHFQGRERCTVGGMRGDFVGEELNNKTSSIRVYGTVGARVCDGPARDGECIFISSTIEKMEYPWDNRIVSYETGADNHVYDGEQWRPPVRHEVCFYEGPGFRGYELCVKPGQKADLPPELNNKISSIRVLGEAAVKVCKESNGLGSCIMVNRTMGSAGRFDDVISSFEVGMKGTGGRFADRGPNQVCFFEGADFQGLLECAVPGEAKDSLPDFDNLITSIEVKGEARVRICEHSGYDGWCEMIERDVKRIGDRWNNAVSSYQVVMDGMDGNEGVGSSVGTVDRQQAGAGGEVCFYEDPGFQGFRVCVAPGARADLSPELDDKISSIQMWGQVRVKVCKQSNESGACLVTSRSMYDMSGGFGDEISSFQISQEYTAARGEIGERDQVCFYADEGFQGLLACADPGDSLDLPPELNNMISSISMPADVVVMVCDQSAYVPPCLTVAGEAPFLDDEWNNVISYYSVSRQRHQ